LLLLIPGLLFSHTIQFAELLFVEKIMITIIKQNKDFKENKWCQTPTTGPLLTDLSVVDINFVSFHCFFHRNKGICKTNGKQVRVLKLHHVNVYQKILLVTVRQGFWFPLSDLRKFLGHKATPNGPHRC